MTRTLPIPEEVAAEMTPAVRALVESLLERIEELESQLNGLRKTQGGPDAVEASGSRSDKRARPPR